MQALLIGCGNMGGALLAQWVNAPDMTFTVVDPATAPDVPGVRHVEDREGLGDKQFDLVVVAIKPQLVDTVLPAYQPHVAQGATLVSMAAGVTAARIADLLACPSVVRIMPNMASAIGQGVSGLYATPETSDAARTHVEALMARAGLALWVDAEDGIDRVTAVSGSGPGFVFEIARHYVAAAQAQGFSPDQARDLVLKTLAGAVAMALETGADLAVLRDSVTSKKGTTEAGLSALTYDNQLASRLQAAVQAAYDRAVELR